MSTVTIPKSDLEAGMLPLVCVASGAPVESLSTLAVGVSKVPALAGLPSGLISKAIHTKVSGQSYSVRIGRANSVKTKQLAVIAVRVLIGIYFTLKFVGALSAASIGGMLVGLIGIVGIAVVGGALLSKALTVGFASTEEGVTITGAHADWVEAYNQASAMGHQASRSSAPRRRPVVAAGLY